MGAREQDIGGCCSSNGNRDLQTFFNNNNNITESLRTSLHSKRCLADKGEGVWREKGGYGGLGMG